ncbi:MAG: DUF1592 domain-containing protein [Gemmatimonadales bacterium]|nr:DUF1592 domain-containing protein [Gemmatimonadales bacterium]MYL06364.1 DUF1592 domain-containing protein [Gemmatimonadales bacterium]
MKRLAIALSCIALWGLISTFPGGSSLSAPLPAQAREFIPDTIPQTIVNQVCTNCHNDTRVLGNLSLERFEVEMAHLEAETAEKMIRKLRAGMMPPPGIRRPPPEDLLELAETLEARVDAAAADRPDPGVRSFQRLNRAEYERSIRALLGLDIDASAYLPNETISAGFDNIADVQNLSATLLEGYLTAASEISRLALGDPTVTPSETEYEVSRYAEQRQHVPGTPIGTRGGISVVHNFTADGDYIFRLAFQHESTGNFFGQTTPFDEQVELSVDGERRALIDIDRWMHRQDPNGVQVETQPIHVTAGPHRVSAAFIKRFDGPIEDLVSPHEWSLADKKIGYSHGITVVAHLRDLTIRGPFGVAGVSETPTRARVLTCRPETGDEAAERRCAREIVERLAAQAYRRPVDASDVDPLLALYDAGAEEDGFEVGVRTALQGILASPDFIFRFEEPPAGAGTEGPYRIAPLDLATRLAFFLWGMPPDEALIEAARTGELDDAAGVETQVRRMLGHANAEGLATRFAAQWLRLQDLDNVHPDALRFPDFYEQLARDMRRETELLFEHLVREDRSFFELLTADYTFVNERLARHYGIPGVAGTHFRKVDYPDDVRRGVLSHGSILTSTSHANRTSPVLRGKWVMEVLFGTPPPPPPPDVPDLEAIDEAEEGRFLTVRERLEMHRASPACRSCHRVIDPLGLALENFDVTGAYRIKDQGRTVDPSGDLYDGTPLAGPADLRIALLSRSESLARAFTESLMAYALGRRVEYFDMPTVRRITRRAEAEDYRMSAFILGVAESPAFLMSRGAAIVEQGDVEQTSEGM